MAKKKKQEQNIIQPTPDDFVDDMSLHNSIIHHVKQFGFCDVVANVIEAYREQARRYNKEADKLEEAAKKSGLI
ncbi:hypothetical protein LCGC14_1451490 [marine sediment metagenome]|uniref:Uncharacterized protein n=1 Tax=marine sediment metagenome TaxID=412755 RepID=A0A0F9JHN3_9ZZZZ